MWNESDIKFLFKDNINFIYEYYGYDIFKKNNINDKYITLVRIIIKRLAELLINFSHNCPNWDQQKPIIQISTLYKKNGDLNGENRIILRNINNKLHIGFRTIEKNKMFYNKIQEICENLKLGKIHDNLQKHILFEIPFNDKLEEYSTQNPLINSEFEDELKNINDFISTKEKIKIEIKKEFFLEQNEYKKDSPITPKTYIKYNNNDGLIEVSKNLLNNEILNENLLNIKNEHEINYYKESQSIKMFQKHNDITNQLIKILNNFKLEEGSNPKYKYDILIRNYTNKNNNLLIEVKSSTDIYNIRMAIGQILHYSYNLEKNNLITCDKAILLNQKPDDDILDFLSSINIGLLWLCGSKLETNDVWLKCITK